MQRLVLLLLAGAAVASPSEDVVNERPPADRSAIERHWGVDCSATVATVDTLLARAHRIGPDEQSARLDELIPALKTCALLDRRDPGGGSRFSRVYRAVLEWREALEGQPAASGEAARACVKSALERAFDLNQG